MAGAVRFSPFVDKDYLLTFCQIELNWAPIAMLGVDSRNNNVGVVCIFTEFITLCNCIQILH